MSSIRRGSQSNRAKDVSRDSATTPRSSRKDPKAPEVPYENGNVQPYETDGLTTSRNEKNSTLDAFSTASRTAQTSPRGDSRSTLASTGPLSLIPENRDRKSSSNSPRTPKDKGGVLPLSSQVTQPYRHNESDLVSPKFSSKPGRSPVQGPKHNKSVSSTEMVLACNIKQTMHSGNFLHCYRINDSSRNRQGSSKDATDPSREGLVKNVIRSISATAQVGVMTDYQTYLILFSRSKECPDQLGAEKDGVSLATCKFPPVRWRGILELLHSTETSSTKHCKNVLLNIVDVVVGQWRSSRGPWTTKAMSLPLLEIQGKAVKAIEGSVTEDGKQSVAAVMQKYLSSDAGNYYGLEHYLKGLRIQVIQPRMQSSSNKSQLQKTILGLARPDDGQGSRVASPPRVTKFGAGPHDVSFYFNASSRDRSKATVASSKLHAQYKTVAQYFKDHNCQMVKDPGLPLVNVGTRSKPTYYPPELCELVASPDSNNCSALSFGEITRIVGTANVPNLINNYGGKCETRFPGLKMSLANSLSDCQVGLKPQSLYLPSRVKFGPDIKYSEEQAIKTSTGTWKDSKLTLSPCKKGLRMAVLSIGPKQWLEKAQLSRIVENLSSRLKAHKIPLDKAVDLKTIDMVNLRFDETVQGEIIEKMDWVVQHEADAVLVVLPFEMKPLYDYVKRQCDIKSGIHSICVTSPRFVCDNNRFFLHLALKMNLKTGGTNQTLNSVKRTTLNLKETMVAGIQIMLPPKQAASDAKGLIAAVASSGGALSHWPAHVQVLDNKPLNEVFFGLLDDRIKAWTTPQDGAQNGAKQQELRNILIYHNGPAHKACLDAMITLKKQHSGVRLTLIEVSQDHQADVQLPLSLQATTSEKPVRSTVIVRTMEADKTWDFILHGHTTGNYQPPSSESSPPKPPPSKPAPKRKARPVRYSVVHDDIFSTTDASNGAREELEDLTHDMSYLAGCSTSVVSSTLPIYYVGLLCNRIQTYVRPWYHPKPASKFEDKSKVEQIKPMTQDAVTVHSGIKDSMFYI